MAREVVHIESSDDARVAAYLNLKDRELAEQAGGRFIAEGELVVRRLLASGFETESVLVAERRVEEIGPMVPAGVAVYVASDEMIKGIIGFKFHSGVLACGKRRVEVRLEEVVGERKLEEETADFRRRPLRDRENERRTLVVCPEIANAENVGSLVRVAAAFGVDGMVLGERSCDPFWRRSIRVSMGAVFSLPIVRSKDLARDLGRMRDEWGYELAATVVGDEGAEALAGAGRGGRLALLFGSEAQGLGRFWVRLCDRRITIPMHLGTDSLNVAVAAGVVLYHFTRP